MVSFWQRIEESEAQTRFEENSQFSQRVFRQPVEALAPNLKADFETILQRFRGA